ncbi:MAG TPA: hypothetical protein PK076_11490 [Saprospiraceae bacterium]|nr:hypothetical protein [Saprospiraceae bacterium]
MNIIINKATKLNVFDSVLKVIWKIDMPQQSMVTDKPWGGYFTFAPEQTSKFIDTFFSGVDTSEFLPQLDLPISPKILIVEPGKRLSWQYHHRRAELWRCINGPVGVAVSETDQEGKTINLEKDDHIYLKQGQRHRLIGLKTYGIVAELWQHTDLSQLSDEEDIVRVTDDFGR